jgi:hypothetical protein
MLEPFKVAWLQRTQENLHCYQLASLFAFMNVSFGIETAIYYATEIKVAILRIFIFDC